MKFENVGIVVRPVFFIVFRSRQKRLHYFILNTTVLNKMYPILTYNQTEIT